MEAIFYMDNFPHSFSIDSTIFVQRSSVFNASRRVYGALHGTHREKFNMLDNTVPKV